jgi:UDP-2,3-diacylglucosamine pyrophosphatase LpxH
VFHGHQLHNTQYPRWVEQAGGVAYDLLAGLSGVVDRVAKAVVLSPPNLLHRVKESLPAAQRYINTMVNAAADKGFYYYPHVDGVVFGHIHKPMIAERQCPTVYDDYTKRVYVCNTGDWVENRSVLVEHTNGIFEILEG